MIDSWRTPSAVTLACRARTPSRSNALCGAISESFLLRRCRHFAAIRSHVHDIADGTMATSDLIPAETRSSCVTARRSRDRVGRRNDGARDTVDETQGRPTCPGHAGLPRGFCPCEGVWAKEIGRAHV